MLSQKRPDQINILLACLAQEARSKLEACFRLTEDFRAVGSARNGYEVVALALRAKPHLILMGCSVPDRQSIETLFYISQRLPEMGIVMIAFSGDPRFVEAAFAAGALGYISMTTAGIEELYETLHLAYDYSVVPPLQ